ncbi:hypothetical protein ACJX0J_025040, partial [Zea mays]
MWFILPIRIVQTHLENFLIIEEKQEMMSTWIQQQSFHNIGFSEVPTINEKILCLHLTNCVLLDVGMQDNLKIQEKVISFMLIHGCDESLSTSDSKTITDCHGAVCTIKPLYALFYLHYLLVACCKEDVSLVPLNFIGPFMSFSCAFNFNFIVKTG